MPGKKFYPIKQQYNGNVSLNNNNNNSSFIM